jgi:multidrug efflux pump subunit AcrA (membrane-fusion protein)
MNAMHTDATARRRVASSMVAIVAVAAMVGAGVWAWRANVSGKPAMDMNMRVTGAASAFPVTVAAVERAPIAGTVTYTGSVAPYNEQDVFPRVMGRIVEMSVYPGDAVRAGQIVARLDDVELTSKVREAQAATTAADANVAQMSADVLGARHGVTQMEKELEMAEADAGHQEHLIVRDEKLYGTGAISLQDLEATRAAVQSARAKVAAARARLELGRAMEAAALKKREAMTAMASQSRATQETAEVVRGYVTIQSPGTGYVVKRLVAPGVLVGPGMPILKIAEIDRVRLQANVGERDLPLVKVGAAVHVSTTGRGAPTTARVTSVFPFVDAGARTAVVEAVVENRDRRFLPGQYVTMEIVTGERGDALTVPRTALARLGGATRVWIAADGRVEPREVAIGLETTERVEIRAGVSEGEQVVARGHEGLYAGARVAAANSIASPSAGTDHSSHGPPPPPVTSEPPARPKGGGHAGH